MWNGNDGIDLINSVHPTDAILMWFYQSINFKQFLNKNSIFRFITSFNKRRFFVEKIE